MTPGHAGGVTMASVTSRTFAVFKGLIFPNESEKLARIYMIPTDRIISVRKGHPSVNKNPKYQVWYLVAQDVGELVEYTMLLPSWVTIANVLDCLTGTPCTDEE